MSVFTTKGRAGNKVTVVVANVAYVEQVADTNKAIIHFSNGDTLVTVVGYDSVRRNVAKALSSTASVDDLE